MVSENKTRENTIGKVGRPAGLTERQKTFARYYRGEAALKSVLILSNKVINEAGR